MYWAVLTLGPLALGAALALSAQPVFEQIAVGAASHSIWRVLGIFSLSWFAFTLMFWLVPNRRVHLAHAMIGAFLSAALFALAKKAFVAFVATASFNVIYGALATVPIFLFWLYLVWTVILLGASLAASLTTFKDRKVDWDWPKKIDRPLIERALTLDFIREGRNLILLGAMTGLAMIGLFLFWVWRG